MRAEVADPHLSWNLLADLSRLFEYHFMINALAAGSIVAVMAAPVGWMMVLRRESFAGHTLSMMAFPGASAAVLLGVAAVWGYVAFCGAGAIAIALLASGERRSRSTESADIGTVQALALAGGFLFVSLYGGVLGDLEGLLFGNLLGISDAQVLALGATALLTLATLALLGRPLLFASVDPDVADARGVPVRALRGAFLLLLGLAVAATCQITGPLLVFALLLAPAASAQALTARPAASLALSLALGLLIAWVGLGLSYFSPYPAGFFIATVAFAVYLLARLAAAARAGSGAARVASSTAERRPEGVIA